MNNIVEEILDRYIDILNLEIEHAISDQVLRMECILNSPHANFSFQEKLRMMVAIFDSDPEYSKEARDIVRANIAKEIL